MFLDTPGIHRPLHRMNVRMVDAAVESDARGRRASVWSWTSPSRPARAIASSRDLLKDVEAPVFLILNKIDLIEEDAAAAAACEQYGECGVFAEIVPGLSRNGRQRGSARSG